jgi:hypothetical protein
MTTSAALAAALGCIFNTWPGTDKVERRGFMAYLSGFAVRGGGFPPRAAAWRLMDDPLAYIRISAGLQTARDGKGSGA